MGRKKQIEFKGCDDDCFNCEYPDCIKPDKLCRSLPDIEDPAADRHKEGDNDA